MSDETMTTKRHALFSRFGFTLVELMITLAVLAIAAALVSPAIMQMAPAMRLRTAANELHADLMRAKSRAVKENRNIGFSVTTIACPAATEFAPTINGGAYRIFVDDGAGNPLLARNNTYDAGEEILVDVNDTPGDGIEDLPESVAICAQGFATGSTGFTSTGLVQNAASGSVDLRISTVAGEPYYQVNLSVAGSVFVEKL
jgi:prepilin-type N-terminal cleavage/methylation domain-containing protein